MKKTVLTLLAAVLCVALCACAAPQTATSPAPTVATPAPVSTESVVPQETETPPPVLKILDENGGEVGEEIVFEAGGETLLTFYTENIGELNPNVGWDDSALLAAGMTVEMQFEPVFGIRIRAEQPASAALRVYLSATDDWSDAENPPVETTVTITAK